MKSLVTIQLVFIATTCYGGQRAITDTGEEVILNVDGTWQYANTTDKSKISITTNPVEFSKPASSGFMLKSTRNNSACWIDTAKWHFAKASENASAEYQFQLKSGDLYGMSIT